MGVMIFIKRVSGWIEPITLSHFAGSCEPSHKNSQGSFHEQPIQNWIIPENWSSLWNGKQLMIGSNGMKFNLMFSVSGLLISFGIASREASLSTELTKVLEKLRN
ncbi:MAG: hypothetical protein PVH37_06475 [Desulfobacterales bacterium]|jgi:hypothetical protein